MINNLFSDSESRQFDRNPADHLNITVINTQTQGAMGRVANISEDGIMLIGSLNVETEHLYQAEMTYCLHSQSHTILLGLDCLWIKASDNKETGIVWAGFQIIDISPKHQQQLQALFSHPNSL